MSVIEEKAALRKAYLQFRRSLSSVAKNAMDAAIAAHVLHNDAYLAADTVFCYVSLPQEIDTHTILSDAWQRGKRVAVPRCRANGVMDFYAVSSFEDLLPGSFSIPEPKGSSPLCVPSFTDVCIVPCLSMDARGYRLGYGGGYYDRYLSLHPVRTIGLCYSANVNVQLPTDPFDIPIQTLITEKEV